MLLIMIDVVIFVFRSKKAVVRLNTNAEYAMQNFWIECLDLKNVDLRLPNSEFIAGGYGNG